MFSQAVGFEGYPSNWLPFAQKNVQAYDGDVSLAFDSLSNDQMFTQSFPTEDKTPLRYALNLKSSWTIEESVDVASIPNGESANEPEAA